MRITPIGDTALTVTLPGKPPAALAAALTRSKPAGVADVIAAFDSVTVIYDAVALPPLAAPVDRLRTWITDTVADGIAVDSFVTAGRLIELPTHYGDAAGPDLSELAAALGVSDADVVALHTAAEYTVAAVGFLPGFAYLIGLPAVLQVPRRSTPRVRVPAGSVAVGGPYTGVYPVASPGGWHLIGHTPAVLFDPARPDAVLFRVGDRVKFVATDPE